MRWTLNRTKYRLRRKSEKRRGIKEVSNSLGPGVMYAKPDKTINTLQNYSTRIHEIQSEQIANM